MRFRPPRVLDASAIVILFWGEQTLNTLLKQADQRPASYTGLRVPLVVV